MKIIDLRSDTITQPCQGMRDAMANAIVGDDVYGEDPTVIKLQSQIAELFGHEAALFVPSGTMSNQLAIRGHTEPGDEIICEKGSHIFNFESGAAAANSGAQIFGIEGENGVITVDDIKTAVRPPHYYYPHTKLVSLENTHNSAGGTIFPIEKIREIYDYSKSENLLMHMDGARIWNAHIATGIPFDEYGKYFDGLSVCFSKGLGAPVGSVLIGSKEFITKAHRVRKMWGGGMRQVGILAQACLYALENNLEKLETDHKNALELAKNLNSFDNVTVDLEACKTNIVIAYFDEGMSSTEIAEKLTDHGVLCIPFLKNSIRFVTHLDISSKGILTACEIISIVLKDYR